MPQSCNIIAVALAAVLSFALAGCEKKNDSKEAPASSAAPTSGPSPFDALGISATLPAGGKAEATGSQVDVVSSDGKARASVLSFPDLASSGGYAGAKQTATFMGASADWKTDEKRPDGTWALAYKTTPKTGNAVWSVNYSYLVGGKAVVCSGSAKEEGQFNFLQSVCKGLAPKGR